MTHDLFLEILNLFPAVGHPREGSEHLFSHENRQDRSTPDLRASGGHRAAQADDLTLRRLTWLLRHLGPWRAVAPAAPKVVDFG